MNDYDGVLHAILLWCIMHTMLPCCDGWEGCDIFFIALAAFSLAFALKDQCRHSSLGKLNHCAMFRVILFLCIMNAMLPCCDAFSEAQYAAARRNIQRYHNLRREEVGNIGICFFAVVRMFFLGAEIPETLRGVRIMSYELDGVFVHRIIGFDILARTIVTVALTNAHSHGAYLMEQLRRYGVIQHLTSAAFGVSYALANLAFTSITSAIVLYHPEIRTFIDSVAIRALWRRGMENNDRDYRAANQPGYFIGVSNTKLSQRGAIRILGGATSPTSRALRALMTQYIEGGRDPVDEIIRNQL
eukprot:scaffold17585_cov72-Skeletonema_marinoi.AAC.2